MTPSQEDCIGRNGVCMDCPNALESMGWTCMVKWTPSVKKKLGLTGKPPHQMGLYTRECIRCGRVFSSDHCSTQYCSAECRYQAKRISDAKMEAKRKGKRPPQKRDRSSSARAIPVETTESRPYKFPRKPLNRVFKAKACEYCKEAFIPKSGAQKYCSFACNTLAWEDIDKRVQERILDATTSESNNLTMRQRFEQSKYWSRNNEDSAIPGQD